MLSKEKWKDIKGYEGLYQISNLGNVKSLNYNRTGKHRILRKISHPDGRYNITLAKKCIHKTIAIHRLVAINLIPNPEKKLCVNHIDGNRGNNQVDNLEWCTYSENMQHAFHVLGQKANKPFLNKKGKDHPQSKKIVQYDKNGNLIKIWDCISDVKRELNYCNSHIGRCCRGLYKYAYNYIWKFHDDKKLIQKAKQWEDEK